MMTAEQIFQTLQPVIITLLASLAAALTGYGLRLAQQQFSAQQWRLAESLINQAVRAAEQYGGSGEEKKRQALQYAEQALAERGINIDLFALDVAIEAAVWQEINRYRSGPAVSVDGTQATEPST